MSEYVLVNCEYNDPGCIKASLKELGYEYEEHTEAKGLVGYEGRVRKQKANIIVRKKYVGSAANDVGFKRKPNGEYELIISEYDSRKGSKSATNFLEELKQIYAKHKNLKQLKKLGTTISSVKKTTDGRIKIKVIV